jgi:pilus assembly protein CpaC
MDGAQASFLAGGEFPVPIVQGGSNNSVSVRLRNTDVRLTFKPTIVDEDHIRLDLEPEVSTIDFSNGVKFDGFLIPALRTAGAKTSVELRDGQSFALAGLLDNSETKRFSKVPMLGDIPVLGALFRSKSFQKNESELMFIVTAQVVKPMNRDDIPQLRGVDGLKDWFSRWVLSPRVKASRFDWSQGFGSEHHRDHTSDNHNSRSSEIVRSESKDD